MVSADAPHPDRSIDRLIIDSVLVSLMIYRCPSWSEDEKLCVRSVNNELQFYENNDFSKDAAFYDGQCQEKLSASVAMKPAADVCCVSFFSDSIANKLHMQKVSDFALSPGDQPSKVSRPSTSTALVDYLNPVPQSGLSSAGRRLRPGQQRSTIICPPVSVPGARRPDCCARQQELLQGRQSDRAVEQERWEQQPRSFIISAVMAD